MFNLRGFIYDHLLAHGLPPSLKVIGKHFGWTTSQAREIVASMKIGKAVVPHPRTGEIWMAGPFAGHRTTFEVHAGNVTWYANCAWDVLGVAAIVGRPAHLRATCGDCGDILDATVSGTQVEPRDYVAHFLLPAREWYQDLAFT